MLTACSHCDAPLRPGEAYLGWCGECGENLFRMPAGTPRPRHTYEPEGPPPVPEEWRWVARGALFKLAGLLLGVVAALVTAIDAGWDWRVALSFPSPLGVGLLGAALLLDVVGRLLCLGTPQGATRWLVVVSVVSQLGALVAGTGYLYAAPGAEERPGLLVMAALGQVGAAVSFTFYLLSVGVYFRSPPVMLLANALKAAMQGAYGVVVFFAGLFVLAVLLFVMGGVLFFACPCAGCVVMAWAGKFAESLSGPFAWALVVVLVLIEAAYGATLTALLVELWRRRWARMGAGSDG